MQWRKSAKLAKPIQKIYRMQAIEIYIYKDILITEKEVRIRDKACDFFRLKILKKISEYSYF